MIGLAEDNLDTKKDCSSRAAFTLIKKARKELEMALAADVDAATGELAPLVLRALGRNVGDCEIRGARRAAEILLECLPDVSR